VNKFYIAVHLRRGYELNHIVIGVVGCNQLTYCRRYNLLHRRLFFSIDDPSLLELRTSMSSTMPRIVYGGMAPIFCLSRSIHKVKAVSSNLNLALLCTSLRDDDGEHSPKKKAKKNRNKSSSSILKMILPLLNIKKKKRASKDIDSNKQKRHRATTSVGSSSTMSTFMSSVGEDTNSTQDDRGVIESFSLSPYEVSGSQQLSPKKVKIISPPSFASEQQQQVDVEDILLPSSTSSTSMRRTVSVISNLKDIEFLQHVEKKVAIDEDDYGWFVQDDNFSLYHHYYE